MTTLYSISALPNCYPRTRCAPSRRLPPKSGLPDFGPLLMGWGEGFFRAIRHLPLTWIADAIRPLPASGER
jgi:hypothetical protein